MFSQAMDEPLPGLPGYAYDLRGGLGISLRY